MKSHFILSAIFCATSVFNILAKMLYLSASAGVRSYKKVKSDPKKSLLNNDVVRWLVDLKAVRYVIDVKNRLEAQRATKLILMAIIVCISLVINLYIIVSTGPVLQHFKLKTDEWRGCNVEFTTYCPGYFSCRTPATKKCYEHNDCFSEMEYCNSDNRCEQCFHCGVDGIAGIGGVCPTIPCSVSSNMKPKEFCTFNFCGTEVAECTSDSTCVGGFRALLEGVEIVSASKKLLDIEACMVKQNCKEAESFCTDAYPECECAPWDSIFTREEIYGLEVPGTGCHVADSLESDWRLGSIEKNRHICAVNDPAKCSEMGVPLNDGNPWQAKTVQFRDGCCTSDYPFPTSESLREDGGCGEQPSDAPSVASLSIGFFVLNFVPLLPPLIFGRSDSFKKVFKPVTSKFSIRSTSKVSSASGASSGAAVSGAAASGASSGAASSGASGASHASGASSHSAHE